MIIRIGDLYLNPFWGVINSSHDERSTENYLLHVGCHKYVWSKYLKTVYKNSPLIECRHDKGVIHTYIKNSRAHEFYCPICGVILDMSEDKPIIRKPASVAMKIKYTNLKLKSNFNIKRKDTFICWNCYGKYRNSARNALTNSKYCPKCRQEVKNLQRENTFYDVIAVNDLGLQGLRENTVRSDLISNGSVFTQGFNQDDTKYSGLGRYTNGKAQSNPYREQQQITKAFQDINKYGDGEFLKQPSKSWKKSDITEGEYIDEVLGFIEKEIGIDFDNYKDNDDISYDNTSE